MHNLSDQQISQVAQWASEPVVEVLPAGVGCDRKKTLGRLGMACSNLLLAPASLPGQLPVGVLAGEPEATADEMEEIPLLAVAQRRISPFNRPELQLVEKLALTYGEQEIEVKARASPSTGWISLLFAPIGPAPCALPRANLPP
jgi:hypothetical protein